jgi:hypothetical protein
MIFIPASHHTNIAQLALLLLGTAATIGALAAFGVRKPK